MAPMFGGKFFSNPKVGMRHGTASGDTSSSDDMSGTMNEPQNETEVQPQEKGVTVTQNPDGSAHVHVHHTDEHSDHPDMETGMGHAAMSMSDEMEPVDDMQEESAEMPKPKSKGMIHSTDDGAY